VGCANAFVILGDPVFQNQLLSRIRRESDSGWKSAAARKENILDIRCVLQIYNHLILTSEGLSGVVRRIGTIQKIGSRSTQAVLLIIHKRLVPLTCGTVSLYKSF